METARSLKIIKHLTTCHFWLSKKSTFIFLVYLRRLLDKQERVDAIVASIEQGGGDQAQKEEIEQTITPTEKDQIIKVKRTVQM